MAALIITKQLSALEESLARAMPGINRRTKVKSSVFLGNRCKSINALTSF